MIKKVLTILIILQGSITSSYAASCLDLGGGTLANLTCLSEISPIYKDGYNAFLSEDYSNAILYFDKYISENGDPNNSNYKNAREKLAISYELLGNAAFYKKQFREAVENYIKSVSYGTSGFAIQFNLGLSYFNLGEYSNAGLHVTNAYNLAVKQDDIEKSGKLLDSIELNIKTRNVVANSSTNDPLAGFQYYINDLNIHTAWQQVSSPKQVIVAVIDDGISINHPDLSKNIWISPKSEYGSSRIINFQNDNIGDNKTAGEHGTMVAGIIGAITGNSEGIAGIARNVKLMPIRVFDKFGNTKEEFIIKAIDYAIDNGANIINLSLGGTQFKYSRGMDDVIKKAYDRGIFVVIAGGNGDDLSSSINGVNLDINPISPVCNNKGKNFSFGVFATDYFGYKTSWSNFGSCTPFFAPGVDIISTSVPIFNSKYGDNYSLDSGTSFSAPIVSGILALGYNKYGKVPYSVAYDALSRATTTNAKGNPVLDANKYLDNLQAYFDKQNSKKIDGLNKKANIQFARYKRQYSRFTKSIQIEKYQSLIGSLESKKSRLKGDLLIVNNLLIDLLKKEIGANPENSVINSINPIKEASANPNKQTSPYAVVTNGLIPNENFSW